MIKIRKVDKIFETNIVHKKENYNLQEIICKELFITNEGKKRKFRYKWKFKKSIFTNNHYQNFIDKVKLYNYKGGRENLKEKYEKWVMKI